MIDITINIFETVLPFVGTASEDVFYKMTGHFETTYDDLVANIIGQDYEGEVTKEGTPLFTQIERYVMIATFLDRLHSQDIIMTDNGFGVVNNDNIAPASQTRVDALERELTYRRDMARHNIINELSCSMINLKCSLALLA